MNLGAENNRFDTIFCNNLDVENGIMGGGVNVTQNIIGGESDWLTEVNTAKTIALTDDINNYDYLIFVLEFRRGTSTSYENNTVLARVGYTNSINVDHSIGGEINNDNTYTIKVSITIIDTGTTANIYQGAIGSAYSGSRIKQVIGIKLTKNLDNATSLNETLLYSGNDHITNVTATNSYTMVDTIDNYNYLLVTIKTYRTGVEDATTIIIEDEDKYYSWETNYSGNLNPSRFSAAGFVHVVNNTLEFGLRYMGSDISYAYISSVIGIKKNSLSTADIAEMAMPSEITESWTINSLNTTWGSSIDPHEIPANGWVMIRRNFTSGSDNQALFTSTKNTTSEITYLFKSYSISTALMFAYMPVRKGEHIVYRSQDSAGSVYEVTFIYTVGDAKALGLI